MSIELLTKLTNAVSYAYRQDPCCPSVIFSTLQNGQIYGSIVRYTQKYGGGKQIITSTNGTAMSIVIETLCDLFINKSLTKPKIDPIDLLREARLSRTEIIRSENNTWDNFL